MSNEFPVDRWLRKHMRPGNTLLAMVVFFIGAMVLHKYVSLSCYQNIMATLILLVIGWAVILMTWMVVWRLKHPTKFETCKECGRVKPPEYKD